MANAKNLTLSHIKKQDAKRYKDKKQVLFDDGTVKVDVDVSLRSSKKNQVIADLFKLIREKSGNHESMTGELITAAMISLIIKQFTTIDVKGLNTLDDHVELFVILSDNGYLSPIMNAFDKVELQTMIDEINTQLGNWNVEIQKMMNESKLKQDEQLEESKE